MDDESRNVETELVKRMTQLIQDIDVYIEPEYTVPNNSDQDESEEEKEEEEEKQEEEEKEKGPFIAALTHIIQYDIVKSEYTNLDELAIEYISLIIEHDPDYLISIEQVFVEFYSTLTNLMIPNILSLLMKLYICMCPLKNGERVGELCGPILKFILSVLIQEEYVLVPNKQDTLVFLHKLVDSYVELMGLYKIAQKKHKQSRTSIFVKKLFSC